MLCGICGGQSSTGVGFLRVFRFPLSILIPPTVPHSSPIIRGWYNRPVSGRNTKNSVSPHSKKLKKGGGERNYVSCYFILFLWKTNLLKYKFCIY
jgi:hypothetical protein